MFNKRNLTLPLVAVVLVALLLGPSLLAVAAPPPAPAAAPAADVQAGGGGKTFIDWLVVKHITVQGGGMDMSSNLDMQAYIITNIGNADTDFDTSGGLTTAGESTFNGGIDLNGTTFKVDADGDTTFADSTDDIVLLTSGAATGTWSVRTGNLTVGNGTPSVHAVNGEDAYVEGDLEIDGTLTGVALKGTTGAFTTSVTSAAFDVNGGTFTIDADADTTLAAATDDQALFTLGAATGYLSIRTGNLSVGNGTPSVHALNGEDLYVEGDVEVDGTLTGVAIRGTTGTFTTSLTAPDVTATDDLFVTDDADINDNLACNDIVVTATSDFRGNVANSTGILTLADSVDVSTILRVTGAAIFNSTVGITGTATFGGAIDANSTLGVNGAIIGDSTLAITSTSDLRGAVSNSTGILTLNDKVDIADVARFAGAAIFNSTLGITGTATFGGAIDANSTLGVNGAIIGDSTLAITSTSDLRGAVSNSTGILTLNDSVDVADVARFAGALIANSTFAITGTATFGGAIDANSTAGFNGAVAMDSTLGVTGTASLNGGATLGVDSTLAAGVTLLPTGAQTATNVYQLYSTLDEENDGVTKTMGIIPANARIVDTMLIVATAFDDSGTDILRCGWDVVAGGGAAKSLVNDMDVASGGVNRMGDGGDMPYALAGTVGASARTIKCFYDGQNSNPANGTAILIVTYAVP